jgi:hypothetical protein
MEGQKDVSDEMWFAALGEVRLITGNKPIEQADPDTK